MLSMIHFMIGTKYTQGSTIAF